MARARMRRHIGYQAYPMAVVAGTAGQIMMLNSAGFLTPAVAAASNKGCVGVLREAADNSGGSAGDIDGVVEEGIFTVTAVGAVAAEVLTQAFASDSATVSSTQATNEPSAGVIRRIRSATSVDVEISAFAGRAVS